MTARAHVPGRADSSIEIKETAEPPPSLVRELGSIYRVDPLSQIKISPVGEGARARCRRKPLIKLWTSAVPRARAPACVFPRVCADLFFFLRLSVVGFFILRDDREERAVSLSKVFSLIWFLDNADIFRLDEISGNILRGSLFSARTTLCICWTTSIAPRIILIIKFDSNLYGL